MADIKYKTVEALELNTLKQVIKKVSREQKGYKPDYEIEQISIPEKLEYADIVKLVEEPSMRKVWFSAFHKGHRHARKIIEQGIMSKGAWVNSDLDVAVSFIKGSKVSAKKGDVGYVAVIRATVMPANNSSAYSHHLLNENTDVICAIRVRIK